MDHDHVFGNAVFFDQTKIYSTARTRELIAERTPNHISEFKKQWSGFQKEWTEAAKTAKDEVEKLDYEDGVRFAQKVTASFPKLEVRLPDQTFEGQVELKGPKRTINFMTFGGGHTDSDALLYLPDERIVFTGDLVVIKNHPALFNGHPREWLTILKKIKELEPAQLIPGHGELGTKADVTQVEDYINELMNMAEKNRRSGGTAEDAASLPTPAFTKDWANDEAFAKNMKFLHELIQQ
jgi:cyclase